MADKEYNIHYSVLAHLAGNHLFDSVLARQYIGSAVYQVKIFRESSDFVVMLLIPTGLFRYDSLNLLCFYLI